MMQPVSYHFQFQLLAQQFDVLSVWIALPTSELPLLPPQNPDHAPQLVLLQSLHLMLVIGLICNGCYHINHGFNIHHFIC